MDVEPVTTTEVVHQHHHPESPVETLSDVGSKKHRMQTGQENDIFTTRYQLLEQVGSGASGTVWKCCLAPGQEVAKGNDEPIQGKTYAAKIIDLRPFKLRERFSMQRLMREVDIMQRLRHPNIIRLVEALDTPEQLVLILEYAPGVELFDAILSKTKFSEDEARPVFVQVGRALQYMHSKQIVHRDVKPENVMIIDRVGQDGLYPEAKLLDFGLSKAIDSDTGGSMARTFVGTPSYLAPEVEEKKGGKGKPYGTPVDCWSLGAMLYVMLVARFPEFQVQGARKTVRMHGPLWEKVSAEAKELIQRLMAFDAGARLTVDKALRHPWLGDLAEKDPPPPPLLYEPVPTWMQGMASHPDKFSFSVPPGMMGAGATAATSGAPRYAGQHQQRSPSGSSGAWGGRSPIVTEQQTPPARKTKSFVFKTRGPTIRELDSDEASLPSVDHGMGEPVNDSGDNKNSSSSRMHVDDDPPRVDTAMQVVRMGLSRPPPDGAVPLLHLQNRITQCIETAVTTYTDCPEGAASLRRSATLCRESLRESVTLLRKIEKTAAQVISLFPDLTLAVEEGEPDLARDFFSTVKGWVREMYTAVSVVQAHNSANAREVGLAMKEHAVMGHEAQRMREEILRQQQKLERQQQSEHHAQQRRHQQHQHQQGHNFTTVGGTTFVAKGGEQPNELNGTTEGVDQKREDVITVDDETFQVVRQIKELRDKFSRTSSGGAVASAPAGPVPSASADSSMATATASPGTTATAVAADGSQATASAAEGATANAVASDGSEATANAADGSSAAAVASEGTAAAAAARNATDGEKLINLFLQMTGRGPVWPEGGGPGGDSSGANNTGSGGGSNSGSGGGVGGGQEGPTVTTPAGGGGGAGRGQQVDINTVAGLTSQMSIEGGRAAPECNGIYTPQQVEQQRVKTEGAANVISGEGQEQSTWNGGMQLAKLDEDKADIYTEVQRALQMLHEIDDVLEQLSLFWANSEVIFDVLLRKGDLVEKFVAFANKPRLLQRFRERLADYKRFWEGVQSVCNKYVCGQNNCSSNVGEKWAQDADNTGGAGTSYDGSSSTSSNRTYSNNSSTGSQSQGEGEGEREAMPPKEGLGGVGQWATMGMRMGMDIGGFGER